MVTPIDACPSVLETTSRMPQGGTLTRQRIWGSLSATGSDSFGEVLKQIAQRVADGETVTFRSTGNSMVPLIHSRDEVVVSPVDPTRVQVGDIVLTKVAGNVYIHLVKAIEPAKRRVQIGNNRGGINGWTGFDRVYGIAVSVAGTERPGARAKVVQRGEERGGMAIHRPGNVRGHPRTHLSWAASAS